MFLKKKKKRIKKKKKHTNNCTSHMKSRLIRSLELGSLCTQTSYEQCRAANLRNTVTDETWKSYASEARTLVVVHRAKNPGFGLEEGEACMEQLKGDIGADFAMFYIAHNIDREFYSQYLYTRSVRGIKCNTVRCALLKAQEVFGQNCWAGNEDVIMETDGADSRAAERSPLEPPIGSITEAMLHQLLTSISHPRAGSMRMAMTVQFGAALRYNELKNLRAQDVKREGIYLTRTKTMKARYAFKLPTPFKRLDYWPTGRRALVVLHALILGKTPDTLLFPSEEFTMTEYNAQIKAAAQAHGWTSTVRFRGSHSLRHGGVGTAKDTLTSDRNPAEISKILMMSEEMVEHYGASNAEKAEKFQRKVVCRSEWSNSHLGTIAPEV